MSIELSLAGLDKKQVSIQDLKYAATGRELDLMRAASFTEDELSGRNGPCPKCGGTDRFFTSKKVVGVAHCRNCFSERNGDWLAAIKWRNDWTLPEAITFAADYLGLKPVNATDCPNGQPVDMVEAVAKVKRMPMESFKAFGAKAAVRDGVLVARVPMFGSNREVCSHFDMSTISTGLLKGKNEKGKESGLFVPVRDAICEDGTIHKISNWPEPGETIHIVEGVKDAASLHGIGLSAIGLPGSSLAKKFARLFAGCHVIIIPDRDTTGEDGARKTAGILKGRAASVRIAILPGELKAKEGDGVREVLAMRDGEALLRQAIDHRLQRVADPVRRHPGDRKSVV